MSRSQVNRTYRRGYLGGSRTVTASEAAIAGKTPARDQQQSSSICLTLDIELNQGVSGGRFTRKGVSVALPSHLPRFMLYIITSIDSDKYAIASEIPVIVREIGDENDNYVARFPDANVNASGDTPDEAMTNLKSILLAKFEYFSSLPSERLGPEPRRQLAVLKSFIRRKR